MNTCTEFGECCVGDSDSISVYEAVAAYDGRWQKPGEVNTGSKSREVEISRGLNTSCGGRDVGDMLTPG